MAEDVIPSYPNPCCALWIKRNQKLEKSRDALRQSVKILEAQIDKQSVEIGSLKKEAENQEKQRGQPKNERIKEANIKKDLEKQILDLKAKISSLENIKSSKSIDEGDVGILKARISAGQEEVKSLKELLEEERRKTCSEGRKTESEKKKATEAWKLLKDEKKKADEHKCLLEAEKAKLENFRLCLEKFKAEANESREKLSAEIAKGFDVKKQIEVERLKAIGEKKRADSERTKVKKQKKLIKEEKKRVLDVKKQANHLCQKLEEERRKREQIQKKLEDLSVVCNFGGREKNVCKTLKTAELKLLKGQLRLERKRVKHAERVAKQEKYEKRVVVQEVHLLKQNLTQILYRLNMIDGLVSHNVGSTDVVQKTMNYPDLTRFKLNDLLRSKKDDFDSQTEYGRSEIHFGDPFTYAEPIGECIGLPVSGGCRSRPKTGINSESESPVGGSLRKTSQSSAVCSTSIHFSDRKLMGSQGRDSVVEISTTKLAEKANHSLTIAKFPSEAAQIGIVKSHQARAKDSDGNAGLNGGEKPCLNASTYKAVSRVSDNSSKKRKVEISNKSYLSEDMLVNGDRMRNVEQYSSAKFPQKEGQSDLCKSYYDHIKNIASTSCQNEKSSVKRGDRKKAGKSICKYNREPYCVQEAGPDSSEGIDEAVTSLGNKQSFLKGFEKMISGGCLKLLELENYSDELRYINALEMPLSPTLPEIDGEDGSYAVIVRDSPVTLCSSDIMNLEIGSGSSTNKELSIDNPDSSNHLSSGVVKLNKEVRGCQPMDSDFFQTQSEVKAVVDPASAQRLNLILPPESEKLTEGNSFISAKKDTGHNIQQSLESGLISTVPNLTFLSSSSKVKSLSKVVDEIDPGRIICFFTSFSSARNMDSMSRIIRAFNSVSPQNLAVSKTDLLIVEVLDGLQLEDHQSEEKVAVFLSLLLGNLSERMSDHCKRIVDEDSFQFLESFSMEIVRAASAGKTKYALNHVFRFDILFRLMESFLIAREVLVIGDVKHHPSSFPAFPDHKFHLEDATVSQFIAGCTILASICVAADDIGVLLVFSYKLLLTCHDNITWVLLALHVLASIFGKGFFNMDSYSSLVITINSVVSLLEGRLKSASYSSSRRLDSSTSGMVVDFSPCKQCPFAADFLCMDKLVSFLLDALEDYSGLDGNDSPNIDNYFVSSSGSAPTRANKGGDSGDAKRKYDVQCDASCAIFGYGKLAGNHTDSRRFATGFCDFTDIISLVELVAQYMGWEWMSNEAVPRLLKMLEVCVREEFSAALFVLVGELGRHGSSSGGYHVAGIAELRSNLAELLDTLIAKKASLPTQVAAVGAMLNLLPLKFEDILYEHRDDSCESPCIKHIQKWFFKLSGEQQAALKHIFGREKGDLEET